MTTDELIETLERLEKEATPGPWSAKRIDYEEYGIDVSFEINASRKSPVLQTIMVERHEVASVRADWANCELVTALRNHLPALISALKENKRLREFTDRVATGDWPRLPGEPYRDDGSPSKMDKCAHGRRLYEDCDECACAFARAALQPQGDAKP